jgi:hypothetical protein
MDKKSKLGEVNLRIGKLNERIGKKNDAIIEYEEKKKGKPLTQGERIDRLEKLAGLQ